MSTCKNSGCANPLYSSCILTRAWSVSPVAVSRKVRPSVRGHPWCLPKGRYGQSSCFNLGANVPEHCFKWRTLLWLNRLVPPHLTYHLTYSCLSPCRLRKVDSCPLSPSPSPTLPSGIGASLPRRHLSNGRGSSLRNTRLMPVKRGVHPTVDVDHSEVQYLHLEDRQPFSFYSHKHVPALNFTSTEQRT